MRPRNRVDTQIFFLLLVSHCLGKPYRATLSQRPLTAAGQAFFLVQSEQETTSADRKRSGLANLIGSISRRGYPVYVPE